MNKIIVAALSSSLILGTAAAGFALSSNNKNVPSDSASYEVVENPENKAQDNDNVQTVSLNSDKNLSKADARVLAKPVAYDTADKDDVFHMMLNSIDYYDKVSGTMMFSSDDPDIVNVVSFQSVLSQSLAYSDFSQCSLNGASEISAENLSAPEFETITFCENDKKINASAVDKTISCDYGSVFHLENVCAIDDEERMSVADDGQPEYFYRCNPTNVEMSSMCLFPQEIAFGFLGNQELWDIVDTVTYEDKLCYLIQGETASDYGSKLNVAKFEFLVDANTGVLVKYEGFDANGELSDFMYTENLQFEDKAEPVQKFDKDLFAGYTDLTNE